MSQFLPTKLSESSLSPRFHEPELCIAEGHLRANLLLALFVNVKAGKDLAIAFWKLTQNPPDQLNPLPENCVVLGISARIGYRNGGIEFSLIPARLNRLLDMGGHLPAHHCPDK